METRTLICPDCHCTLGGDWAEMHCYCTAWTPRHRNDHGVLKGIGSLLQDDEVVRLSRGTLIAVRQP